MVSQGKTSEQIDAVVKVNDLPALKALAQFDSELKSRLISATSTINQGTQVSVFLPLAQSKKNTLVSEEQTITHPI